MVNRALVKKHRILVIVAVMVFLSIIGYFGAKIVYFEENKDDLVSLCSNYVDAICLSVPSEIINYSDTEINTFRKDFVQDKVNLHDQIFSVHSKNDTYISTIESILNDISDRTNVLASLTYQHINIEKIDTDFGCAQITFTVEWVENDYTKTESSNYSLLENRGSTRYILNCVNEDGSWKINEIHFEPIL